MPKLPRHLLERSPEETARRLCLMLLDDAGRAAERLHAPDDDEALHDFRVALRRLRSLMRAYRDPLRGSAGKKARDRVKALASSTNLARDAEVQIRWLSEEGERLGEPARSGALHLIDVLREKQSRAPAAEVLDRRFGALRKLLTRRLRTMRLDGDATSFTRATSGILDEHARVLRTSLEAARSAENADLLHRARIEAKRLRYVLEPLGAEIEEARPIIGAMKSLQDLLGELQDTRVLMELISAELEASALEAARELRAIALREGELPETHTRHHPGLLALLKAQRLRRDRCFAELTARFRGAAGRPFFSRIDRLVEHLRNWPEGELPRRRFLLTGLPEELRRQRGVFVREGWLPGKAVRERLRAAREGRRVRYLRVVEGDGGRGREESISRRAFAALWPLTEGRRLEYRSFELIDDGRIWTVSILPDDVILASVSADAGVPIPEPIRSELLREVTGVKKYEPERLWRLRAASPKTA